MVAASNIADVDRLVDVFRALAALAPEDAIEEALTVLDTTVNEADRSAFLENVTAIISNLVEEQSRLSRPVLVPEQTNGMRQGTDEILTEARLRGLLARMWLLTEEGGVRSAEQLGQLLGGITRQRVASWRAQGRLLAIDLGNRGVVYPVWQVREGVTLPGLDRVLAELDDFDPWMQASFLLNPNTWLGGSSPLSELRRGHVERVVAAAARYAA